MKIELHILQNFPPHNLNRDDTGAPKDTEFGGWRRARISSQCLKRSIRWSEAFRNEVGERLGMRTKRVAGEVARLLNEVHGKEQAKAIVAASAAVSKLVSTTDTEGRTNVLFYVGSDELRRIANGIAAQWKAIQPLLDVPANSSAEESEGKKGKGKGKKVKQADSQLDEAIKPVLDEYYQQFSDQVGAIDIALFGRMLAENPMLNIDASCQVAHAISTNRVSMEFDYFTAVDDLLGSKETGAGMIGTVGFNSSCFYRYAVIDAEQLARNLGNSNGNTNGRTPAVDGIRAFLRGSIAAVPTGKQNTFAAHTPPSLIMAVVRPNGAQPMSLANAFETPAQPGSGISLVGASVKALDAHWKSLNAVYGDGNALTFVTVVKEADKLDALKSHQCESVSVLIEKTMDAINGAWGTGGDA